MKTKNFLVFLTLLVTTLVGFALPFLSSGKDWDPVFFVGLKTVALKILPTSQHHLLAGPAATESPISASSDSELPTTVTADPAITPIPGESTPQLNVQPTNERRDRRNEDSVIVPVTGPSAQPTDTRRPTPTHTFVPEPTETQTPQPTNTRPPTPTRTPRPTDTPQPTPTNAPPTPTDAPAPQPTPTDPPAPQPTPTDPPAPQPTPTDPPAPDPTDPPTQEPPPDPPTEPPPTDPPPVEPPPTDPPSTEPPAAVLVLWS